MQFYQILSWFKRNLKEIILSQRKTLAYLVFGLMSSRRAGVAAIGRGIKSRTTTKHNIKRVARFLSNPRIDTNKAMKTLLNCTLKNMNKFYILIDWTTLSNFGYQILKATIIGDGRGIPIYFKTYKEGFIKERQTSFERKLIDYLKSILPNDKEVIIVADRGFGQKPELLKYIESVGFYYIVRNKEVFVIKNKDYCGTTKDIKIRKDSHKILKEIIWPHLENKKSLVLKKQIKSDVIICHKKGCKKRWVLYTNTTDYNPLEIINIYYKRMQIEETIKDEKNELLGFAFKKLRLSSCERYDKMMLIISYAYFFLTLFGLYLEQRNYHLKMMPNTVKYRSFSLFQVGLFYFRKMDIPIPKLLRLIGVLRYEI